MNCLNKFTAGLMVLLFFGLSGCGGTTCEPQPEVQTPAKPTKPTKVVWRPLPGVGLGQIIDVCFVDEKRAWMAMNKGSLLKSTDGGMTWRTVKLPRADDAWNALQIRFLKRKDGTCFGWAVSTTGRIYHTADGVKWARQTPHRLSRHSRRKPCLDFRIRIELAHGGRRENVGTSQPEVDEGQHAAALVRTNG